MKERRITAAVLFAVLLLTVLMPLPHHDCDGEHCAVCTAIHAVRTVLPVVCAVSLTDISRICPRDAIPAWKAQDSATPVARHVLILD